MATKTNSTTRPHNPARRAQTTVKVTFFVLAAVAVLGAAGWSTYSLYELLIGSANQVIALLACSALDMAWMASLSMLVADVYGGDWRAEVWSWGTMAASMVVSGLHGSQVGSWTVAVLGVLFTLASKGLTATYLHTLRPKMSPEDRSSLKALDYERRVREIQRQKQAELANDDFRWGEVQPRFRVVEATGTSGSDRVNHRPELPELPVQPDPTLELELPNWVSAPPREVNPPVPQVPNNPELEPAAVQVPPEPPKAVPVSSALPNQNPMPEPKLPKSEAVPVVPVVPTERKERVRHLAQEIGNRGGQLNSVPLSEVIDTYGLKPTAKATASNLRKDAHQHWLDNAPGTGHYR